MQHARLKIFVDQGADKTCDILHHVDKASGKATKRLSIAPQDALRKIVVDREKLPEVEVVKAPEMAPWKVQ